MSGKAERSFVTVASEKHAIGIFVILVQTTNARVEIRHMRIPLELIIFRCDWHRICIRSATVVVCRWINSRLRHRVEFLFAFLVVGLFLSSICGETKDKGEEKSMKFRYYVILVCVNWANVNVLSGFGCNHFSHRWHFSVLHRAESRMFLYYRGGFVGGNGHKIIVWEFPNSTRLSRNFNLRNSHCLSFVNKSRDNR